MGKKKQDPKFNAKQKKFCEEYLKLNCNGKQAAISAGYSAKTAEAQASRLLTYVKVKEYIAKMQEKANKETQNTLEQNLRDLIEVKNRCMQNVSPKMVKEDGEWVPMMIEDKEGNECEAYIFDANGALRAIDILLKVGGHYPAEKRQLEFTPVNLRTQQASVVKKKP